jgi:methylase of polypeptide subunit release factors
MRKALLHLNHALIQSLINKDDVVVDMTCGKGYDTEFLAKIAKHVYAFDIQIDALHQTKQRLVHLENITYVHDSFEHVSNYIQHAKLYVFNLGYLPGGDKSVTTQKDITLHTLKALPSKVMNGSNIMLISYIGHDNGMQEYLGIKTYLTDQIHYQMYETRALHHAYAPIMIWIHKKDSI